MKRGIIMQTFYLSTMPDFRELAEMCKTIDNTQDLHDKHINIVSLETGEVYAIRHNHNLWEFCNYISVKDARYYDLEKKYNRGLITYWQFLELIRG